MTETKTGRPAKYSEAQVIEGIEIVEQNGDTPSGDTVKKAMCSRLGVAAGINAQSLDKEVQRLLEERHRHRRERLIGALPPSALNSAKDITSRVEAAVLEHLGEQHETLRTVADSKVAELMTDLGNQREQIRNLQSRIGDKDREISDLENDKLGLERQLEEASTEIEGLRQRLVERDQEGAFETRMVALMEKTLGERPVSNS